MARRLELDGKLSKKPWTATVPRPEVPMGIKYFMKRLKKTCPWLEFGYFNPYRG